MNEITLRVETVSETREINLANEVSFGRANLASIVLDDATLSRLHATVWREGDAIWIQDENSSNGTFVNNQRLSDERLLKDGDEILLGGNTRIYVEIRPNAERGMRNAELKSANYNLNLENQIANPPTINPPVINPHSAFRSPQLKSFPIIPVVAGISAFFIIVFAVGAILIIRSHENSQRNGKNSAPPVQQIRAGAMIPVPVIDPLGGQDPDDLDDLIASWEVEEKELNAADIEEIKTTTEKGTSDLKVSVEFWQQQRDKALNHAGASGAERTGLIPLPPELIGGGVPKQKAKLAELINTGKYKQPLDFADLAELRLNGILVEMPMATESYVLDVGGSAGDGEFTSFDWDNGIQPIAPGSEKYKILQKLADNFDGQKYDLNNPRDRKQMRMRLLRMYNANSRKLFEEICNAYYQKFHVPLRVTSLTRSMDYQISLNKTNANSFRVSGKGSLPPHTSGCAFDMSRKNLSADEQNFMMTLLSTMERNHKLDSLREGSDNACFHTFIYPDGIEPKT
ncbi:MAG: DUF5715 family protein [Pyrinomonadaceae bacterium]